MDLKEIMAVNLRRKRHDLQMTQEELAERAGLSARYVGAIERGDVNENEATTALLDKPLPEVKLDNVAFSLKLKKVRSH